MASTAEIILNSFLEVAGEQWRGVGIAELLGRLASPQGESARSAEPDGGGFGAALQKAASSVWGGSALNTVAASASGGSTGSSTLGRVASAVFGSALGMAPLAKAIVSLFTGNSEEPELAPVKYALPPHLRFEAANGPGPGFAGADYGQDGLPRAQGLAVIAPDRTAAIPAQITVQVNAMDSRSFLDHKEEIALAVREAMLNMHSLNDVVSDL